MTLFEEADRSGHEGRAASIGKPCNAVGSFMAREGIKVFKNTFLTRHGKYKINSDCKNRS
jgi:hypothetical protein